MQRLYKSRDSGGRERATIKRADAEVIQTKGPQREEQSDKKESECRGYPKEGPTEGREWRQ